MTDASLQEKTAPAGPAFELDGFVPYLFNRIVNRMNRSLTEALRDADLAVPDWRVLAVLRAGRGRSLGELATYTVIEQSTLSRTIDRMQAAGLVIRQSRPGDGRIVDVRLTEAGRRVFERIWPIAEAQCRAALGGIDGDEAQAFVGTLRKVLANVRETPFA